MTNSDKKVLIIISGVFLIIMSFLLFVTFQKQDNMMSNSGKYNGNNMQLGEVDGDGYPIVDNKPCCDTCNGSAFCLANCQTCSISSTASPVLDVDSCMSICMSSGKTQADCISQCNVTMVDPTNTTIDCWIPTQNAKDCSVTQVTDESCSGYNTKEECLASIG